MTMSTDTASSHGLVSSSLLDKIDRPFACNAGDYVDLPQIVAVGDQSSGKSSVLEGLGKQTPLTLFSATLVASMNYDVLEDIDGEEMKTQSERIRLEKEIDLLEKGKRIIG